MTHKVEFVIPNGIYINDGEYIGFCSIELVHAEEYILGETKHVLTFPKFTDYDAHEESDLVYHICEAYVANQMKIGLGFSKSYRYDEDSKRWKCVFTYIGSSTNFGHTGTVVRD